MSTITIEPADTGLADKLSSLVFDTSPKMWGYIWGDEPDEFQMALSSAFKEQRGSFSHTLARVAHLNGEPVGIYISYTAEKKREEWAFTFDFFSRLLPEERMAVLSERIDLASYIAPEIPSDALFVFILSVMPAARARGSAPR
jgi:hypothetical protein